MLPFILILQSSFISIFTNQLLSRVQIADMSGRMVKEFTPAANNKYNISDLGKGSYFAGLVNNSETNVVKFTKL